MINLIECRSPFLSPMSTDIRLCRCHQPPRRCCHRITNRQWVELENSVDSNVFNPAADVANALPIAVVCAGGCNEGQFRQPCWRCCQMRCQLGWSVLGLRRCRQLSWGCWQCVTNRSGLCCVYANVANPVDDVINASPIGMDSAGDCIDANVANAS